MCTFWENIYTSIVTSIAGFQRTTLQLIVFSNLPLTNSSDGIAIYNRIDVPPTPKMSQVNQPKVSENHQYCNNDNSQIVKS